MQPRPASDFEPGKLEQVATRIVFLVVGTVVGAWAPLIPIVKNRLGVDEAQLGALLLCLGLGSIVAMPFSGGWAARFGCRRVILIASAVALGAFPVMAGGPSVAGVAIALFAFGAGTGVVDVTMNIQAVIVEKASGRAMMSGFHGLYSVGGFLGAGLGTAMLWAGLAPLETGVVVALLCVALIWLIAKGLLVYGSNEEAPAFVLPKGKVLLIGTLCLIVFLAEGSVLDWSGVFLTSDRDLEASHSGLGYAAFAVAMTVGRLAGDGIVQRLGNLRILLFGGLTTAIGFLVALVVPFWWTSIVGFALMGIGAANIVPVLFTAAGSQRQVPAHLAIAGVTTMGYAGILVGPPLIGFVARATTLSVALGIVAVLALFVSVSAKSVVD